MSLLVVLVLAAFALTVAEALGKCPGWIPKVLICVALLVAFWGR
jgi:hypothetical protein